jgi:hypothetical protein
MRAITLNAFFLLLFLTGVISCKKNDYLDDGGTSTAKTPLSTYDYLKANKYHYFDTTLLLIDHFNLKDSVNKSGTFFAITDFSIHALMINLNDSSLDQLYAQISSKTLTQYMFSDVITLDAASLTPVVYTNWAGAMSAVKKVQQNPGNYPSNGYPVYQLNYIQINGVLDGPSAPPGDPIDTDIPCQTTGIQTATGTTLHVLVDNAVLNKM